MGRNDAFRAEHHQIAQVDDGEYGHDHDQRDADGQGQHSTDTGGEGGVKYMCFINLRITCNILKHQ